MCNKARVSNLFWRHFLSQRLLTRSRYDPGHKRHASTPNQTRITVFSRSGQLPADICATSESPHRTPQSPTKKENTLTWNQNANDSFQRIKGLLENSLLKPLWYYDRNKPVTLQCDASLKGLEACIIQEGKPIAFTSKSLMDTKTSYANIETVSNCLWLQKVSYISVR